MLVLTRKIGESLIIGDDIEVKVVESNGKSVKLAIEAPKDIPVYRKEIYEAIKRENMQAKEQENILSLIDYVKKMKS